MGDLLLMNESRRRPTTLRLPTNASSSTTAGERVRASKSLERQPQPEHNYYSDYDGQSYHHDNNNNNNANGKVRLLISPANDESRGSTEQQLQLQHQQQMAHSAATINSQLQQQQKHRSQTPTTQSRQKNYHHHHHHHHYDYYSTDSNLTSSIPTTQSNHYEDNILLFATEHNNAANNSNNSATGHQQQVSNRHQVSNNGQQVVGQARSPQRTGGGVDTPTQCGATGKFVNYYPSWRQSQSAATSHHQNYSFHVPLHLQQQWPHQVQVQQQQQLANLQPQSGYGFVAPAERVSARGFKQSFKSSTIGHIPNMLKVSVAESRGYEDLYGRPVAMKSENDLLKVHLVPLNSHQEGYDNPFKPGTELSWEADMMVRLMKRGYPLQELPVLVQTAKQVAQVKRREQALAKTAPSGVAAKLAPAARSQEQVSREPQVSTRAPQEKLMSEQNSSARKRELPRRQSSNDLSSGKQVWADTLSRTKSLPRFVARADRDGDSIDRLINSIEREMSDLLQDESPVSEQVSGKAATLDGCQQVSSPGRANRNKRAVGSPQEQQVAARKRQSADSATVSSQAALVGDQRLAKKKQPRACCRIQ